MSRASEPAIRAVSLSTISARIAAQVACSGFRQMMNRSLSRIFLFDLQVPRE